MSEKSTTGSTYILAAISTCRKNGTDNWSAYPWNKFKKQINLQLSPDGWPLSWDFRREHETPEILESDTGHRYVCDYIHRVSSGIDCPRGDGRTLLIRLEGIRYCNGGETVPLEDSFTPLMCEEELMLVLGTGIECKVEWFAYSNGVAKHGTPVFHGCFPFAGEVEPNHQQTGVPTQDSTMEKTDMDSYRRVLADAIQIKDEYAKECAVRALKAGGGDTEGGRLAAKFVPLFVRLENLDILLEEQRQEMEEICSVLPELADAAEAEVKDAEKAKKESHWSDIDSEIKGFRAAMRMNGLL